MNSITEILIYLGVIAVMSERLMEILKTFTDMANRIKNARIKSIVIHLVTLWASMIAALIYPPADVAILSKINSHLAIVVVGLLGSSGSSIWHDLLGVVTALKDSQKIAAEKAKDGKS